jgi:S-disulfanyl-L-cysteine oxidoreductase SoxD
MSRRWKLAGLSVLVAGIAVTTLILSAARARERPPQTVYGIGHTATPDQIAKWDLTVFPDGRGLPAGAGTARQGKAIYASQCASCHGRNGEGTEIYPSLAGGQGTLASNAPVLTVGSYWPYATTLWDYTRRAMPYANPGTLKTDEVYALTAYILYLNGIVREEQVLDEKSLPRVKMPNRDGFYPDARPDLRPVKVPAQTKSSKPS